MSERRAVSGLSAHVGELQAEVALLKRENRELRRVSERLNNESRRVLLAADRVHDEIWKTRAETAEAELQARELHHFETEQENAALKAELEIWKPKVGCVNCGDRKAGRSEHLLGGFGWTCKKA